MNVEVVDTTGQLIFVYLGSTPDNLSDSTLFSVVTTLAWTYTYDPVEDLCIITFQGTLAIAQVYKVLQWIAMPANEVTITKRAYQALTDNQNWINNSLPQIVTGANNIIGSSTATADAKSLANGVKNLANQMQDICNQNMAIIKKLLQLS